MVDLSFYTSYKELYQQALLFARRKVLKVYHQTQNKSLTARIFQTHLSVVRKIIRRFEQEGEEGLRDRSRRPKHSPHRTALSIEGMILAERKKTGYGRDRIARNLSARGIPVKPSTVRYVLRRYQVSPKYKRSRYRKRQRFYDFEELHPLEHFEVDLKEIYDQSTLSEETLQHANETHIPPYPWTAIDIKTRIRFLSYSYEKTFSNGLVFMLSLLYFLRMLGIEHQITFQTDNGEEFGGKSVDKLYYLNRQIFGPLHSKLIHIPKGKKEWDAFVKRSHQTDDNEFYILQLELYQDVKEFFWRAMRWQWVYNTKRRHSTIKMTPMEKLLSYRKVPKYAAIFPITNLDTLAVNMHLFFPKISHSTGGNVLTEDLLFSDLREEERLRWLVRFWGRRSNLSVKWITGILFCGVNKFIFGKNIITIRILPTIITLGGVIIMDGGDLAFITIVTVTISLFL